MDASQVLYLGDNIERNIKRMEELCSDFIDVIDKITNIKDSWHNNKLKEIKNELKGILKQIIKYYDNDYNMREVINKYNSSNTKENLFTIDEKLKYEKILQVIEKYNNKKGMNIKNNLFDKEEKNMILAECRIEYFKENFKYEEIFKIFIKYFAIRKLLHGKNIYKIEFDKIPKLEIEKEKLKKFKNLLNNYKNMKSDDNENADVIKDLYSFFSYILRSEEYKDTCLKCFRYVIDIYKIIQKHPEIIIYKGLENENWLDSVLSFIDTKQKYIYHMSEGKDYLFNILEIVLTNKLEKLKLKGREEIEVKNLIGDIDRVLSKAAEITGGDYNVIKTEEEERISKKLKNKKVENKNIKGYLEQRIENIDEKINEIDINRINKLSIDDLGLEKIKEQTTEKEMEDIINERKFVCEYIVNCLNKESFREDFQQVFYENFDENEDFQAIIGQDLKNLENCRVNKNSNYIEKKKKLIDKVDMDIIIFYKMVLNLNLEGVISYDHYHDIGNIKIYEELLKKLKEKSLKYEETKKYDEFKDLILGTINSNEYVAVIEKIVRMKRLNIQDFPIKINYKKTYNKFLELTKKTMFKKGENLAEYCNKSYGDIFEKILKKEFNPIFGKDIKLTEERQDEIIVDIWSIIQLVYNINNRLTKEKSIMEKYMKMLQRDITENKFLNLPTSFIEWQDDAQKYKHIGEFIEKYNSTINEIITMRRYKGEYLKSCEKTLIANFKMLGKLLENYNKGKVKKEQDEAETVGELYKDMLEKIYNMFIRGLIIPKFDEKKLKNENLKKNIEKLTPIKQENLKGRTPLKVFLEQLENSGFEELKEIIHRYYFSDDRNDEIMYFIYMDESLKHKVMNFVNEFINNKLFIKGNIRIGCYEAIVDIYDNRNNDEKIKEFEEIYDIDKINKLIDFLKNITVIQNDIIDDLKLEILNVECMLNNKYGYEPEYHEIKLMMPISLPNKDGKYESLLYDSESIFKATRNMLEEELSDDIKIKELLIVLETEASHISEYCQSAIIEGARENELLNNYKDSLKGLKNFIDEGLENICKEYTLPEFNQDNIKESIRNFTEGVDNRYLGSMYLLKKLLIEGEIDFHLDANLFNEELYFNLTQEETYYGKKLIQFFSDNCIEIDLMLRDIEYVTTSKGIYKMLIDNNMVVRQIYDRLLENTNLQVDNYLDGEVDYLYDILKRALYVHDQTDVDFVYSKIEKLGVNLFYEYIIELARVASVLFRVLKNEIIKLENKRLQNLKDFNKGFLCFTDSKILEGGFFRDIDDLIEGSIEKIKETKKTIENLYDEIKVMKNLENKREKQNSFFKSIETLFNSCIKSSDEVLKKINSFEMKILFKSPSEEYVKKRLSEILKPIFRKYLVISHVLVDLERRGYKILKNLMIDKKKSVELDYENIRQKINKFIDFAEKYNKNYLNNLTYLKEFKRGTDIKYKSVELTNRNIYNYFDSILKFYEDSKQNGVMTFSRILSDFDKNKEYIRNISEKQISGYYKYLEKLREKMFILSDEIEKVLKKPEINYYENKKSNVSNFEDIPIVKEEEKEEEEEEDYLKNS